MTPIEAPHSIEEVNKAALLTLLSILVASPPTRAEIWTDHVTPTLSQGFDHTGLWMIVGSLAAVHLAQTQDLKMREDFSNYNRVSSNVSRVGDFLGTGIPGVATALLQLYVDPENGKAHAEALIDTTLVTSVLKYASARSRPDSDNHLSMPSGHTSTTFASATSLAYAYGWKAGVPAYLLAAFTGVTRMSDDAHWFSDTVAGAAVGIFWARAVSPHHALQKQKADSISASFSIMPLVSSRFVGGFIRAEF